MTFSLRSPSHTPEPGVSKSSARSSRAMRTIHAVKEGWVYKKGAQPFSGFKRRYCILWTNKRLEYYTNNQLSTMKGSVSLSGLHPKAIQRQNDKLPKTKELHSYFSGFRINTKRRKWYFAVKTHDSRDEWIQTLRAMIDELYTSAYHIKNEPQPKKNTKKNTNQPSTDNKDEEYSESNSSETDSDSYDPIELLENMEREHAQKMKKSKKKKYKSERQIDIRWSNNSITDGRESFSSSSSKSDIDEREKEVAIYQKEVYGNEQPILRMQNKKNESLPVQSNVELVKAIVEHYKKTSVDNERTIIDWDEDDFESDTLSDNTEYSEHESASDNTYGSNSALFNNDYNKYYTEINENKIKVEIKEVEDVQSPRVKQNKYHYNHKYHNDERPVCKTVKNKRYEKRIKLFFNLENYIEYKSGIGSGHSEDVAPVVGIHIIRVKRNKYGKQLFIKYGIDTGDGWYVYALDKEIIIDKSIEYIYQMLDEIDSEIGYEVVFRRKPRKNTKKINIGIEIEEEDEEDQGWKFISPKLPKRDSKLISLKSKEIITFDANFKYGEKNGSILKTDVDSQNYGFFNSLGFEATNSLVVKDINGSEQKSVVKSKSKNVVSQKSLKNSKKKRTGK